MVKNLPCFDKCLTSISTIIEDRLYFASLTSSSSYFLKSNNEYHYFNTDKKLVYNGFNEDFGPLNLGCVYRFNHTLSRKLKMRSLSKRKLVYYTWITGSEGEQRRVNAAFLIGTFMVMNLNMKPEEACSILESNQPFIFFRDASFKSYNYHLSLLNCLEGLRKGFENGFFSMKDFNVLEYEHFEKVDNGDFNWIIPKQLLAFCSPHSGDIKEKGVVTHGPELYVEYFTKNKVGAVIRLNENLYDADAFIKAGIKHHELFFPDGSVPSQNIVEKFIKICQDANSRDVAVAVHCKAGLGRTGTLIACYIMKLYKMTARETIAWARIARPGSIIGHQQNFLDRMERKLMPTNNDDEEEEEEEEKDEESSELLIPSLQASSDAEPFDEAGVQDVGEIELGVSDMNLRKERRKVNNAGKKLGKNVLAPLSNFQNNKTASSTHFLRSHRNKVQTSREVEASNENLSGNTMMDSLQGDKLNSIKMKRVSDKVDQKSRLNISHNLRTKTRSRSLSKHQNLKPIKKDENLRKKLVTKCNGKPKQKVNPVSTSGSSPHTSVRVTRSSMRI